MIQLQDLKQGSSSLVGSRCGIRMYKKYRVFHKSHKTCVYYQKYLGISKNQDHFAENTNSK